jgi:hypothetical protein
VDENDVLYVCQESAAVSVADGIEPVAVDAADAQPIIDVDVTTRLVGEADAVEPHIAGIRTAPNGDEDLVGGELPTVFGAGDDRPVPAGSARRSCGTPG